MLYNNSVIQWLLEEGWTYEDKTLFTKKLAEAFLNTGIPLARLRLSIRLLHPQAMGYGYTWDDQSEEVEYFEAGHELRDSDMYRQSPFAAIFEENAGAIRRVLHDPNCLMDYPILHDLRDEKITDYVALPLIFSDGRRSAITLATRCERGFTTEQLTDIYDALPALARIIENHALKHTAEVLLETYLGQETGRHVLSGKVKRGDGQRIRSVIWFSDMRQSTTLAETMDSDLFLEMLNNYFDCTADAVLEHGGEVLRYIGDAVLAIFPLGPDDGCQVSHNAAVNAANAAKMALKRIEAMNRRQAKKGHPEVACGIGLHVGEVMYGNIGTIKRLEFSVIGSSANEASRLENMTKALQVPVVVSEKFKDLHGGAWKPLGLHNLKGFQHKRQLFTLPSPD